MSLSPRVLSAFRTMAVPVEDATFGGSSRMGEMFAAAQKKQREDAQKALIAELGTVSATLERVREQNALAINRAQAEIADLQAEDVAITAAFEYGESTGNYLPLLFGLELVSEDDYRTIGVSRAEWVKLLTIPEADGSEDEG